MNQSAHDPAAPRYFDDEQIACVVHGAERGLAMVFHERLPPDWIRMSARQQRLVIERVNAIRWGTAEPLPRRSPEQRVKDEVARYIVTGMATIQR